MPITEDIRGRAGVVCSLLQSQDGTLSLSLDDVELGSPSPTLWTHKNFVTSKDYAGGAKELESLTNEQLADFGHYVLTRLLACHSQYGTKP